MPLKIAFPFAANQLGGSSVSGLLLAAALRDLGEEVVVLLHGEGKLEDLIAYHGLEMERFPAVAGTWGHLGTMMAWPKRARFSRQLGLDIVHVNDLTMLRSWGGIGRLGGARVVAHWRTNLYPSFSVDFCLGLADRVVAIAEYNRGQLRPSLRRKSVLEYNPVGSLMPANERRRAYSAIRERLGLPPSSRIVGVFGSFSERKRTHVLADVLREIQFDGEGRPVVGIACGKPSVPSDELLPAKVAQYGLESRLLFPGWQPLVDEWIAACDVLLAPAIGEPFGRAYFDGTRMGVPVVMSSDSGASEVMIHRSTGLVVDPNDTPQIVQSVRELLSDSALSQALTDAAQSDVTRFAAPLHASRVREIYLSLKEGSAVKGMTMP